MNEIINYVKPELLVLIPVLYFIGTALKKSKSVQDKHIPLWLGLCGVVLAVIWVVATSKSRISSRFHGDFCGADVGCTSRRVQRLYACNDCPKQKREARLLKIATVDAILSTRMVKSMDEKALLEAIRQIVKDEARQVIREELKPIQAEQKVANERLSKIEGTQEYTLKWLDRVEERLTPVADYVETMYLNTGTK